MKLTDILMTMAALLAGAAAFFAADARAGSCCGGGSAGSLMVPAYARDLVDLSFDTELYDGFWNQAGKHIPDPPGSDLRQYRLNFGYGHRFNEDWQGSIALPYVWNDNRYAGLASKTEGLGDATISLWYEPLHDLSAWKTIHTLRDLTPALSLGASLLIPTGVSPYDDVESSFDVTGRGFYRLDGNLLIEKTINPWYAALQLGYGTYFERSVNREYGRYVEPYRKDLGNRFSGSIALSYKQVIGSAGDSLTGNLSYAWLHEHAATIDREHDPFSPFAKESLGAGLTYGSTDHDWSGRLAWSHALRGDDRGKNFPTTDIYTVGVRYAFR